MVSSTGWTWDHCEDELTWFRITALYEEWQSRPPVHESVAAYLGIKPKNKEYGNLGELLSRFPTGEIKFE